jgi:hypothetical protein
VSTEADGRLIQMEMLIKILHARKHGQRVCPCLRCQEYCPVPGSYLQIYNPWMRTLFLCPGTQPTGFMSTKRETQRKIMIRMSFNEILSSSFHGRASAKSSENATPIRLDLEFLPTHYFNQSAQPSHPQTNPGWPQAGSVHLV